MDSVGEGEGGENWENGIETCIISCMKRIASPGSMHNTGCLGLVHWDDPEGWYGEGGGIPISFRIFQGLFFIYFLNFILFLNFTILY